MQVLLPEILCDTSFLMHLATGRIHNADDTMGFSQIQWCVPQIVLTELERLADVPNKAGAARSALKMVRSMKKIPMGGMCADDMLLAYIQERGGYVATVDRELKRAVRAAGGHVISLHGDRIILEG